MGTVIDGLYEHEGAMEFLDAATGEWSSTWGTDALGSPGHNPVQVRAVCECGWVGVEMPWSGGFPNEAQEAAIMAGWEHGHLYPIRARLGREGS